MKKLFNKALTGVVIGAALIVVLIVLIFGLDTIIPMQKIMNNYK